MYDSVSPDRILYYREVFAYVQSIVAEDQTVLEDLKATGVEADVRRMVIDSVINLNFDQPLRDMLDAMKTAGITARQSAQVISILSSRFKEAS